MKKVFKITLLVTLCSLIFSCNTDNKQVRFVNLQGNPGQLHLTTPSENLSALSRQGRASEAAISREKQYKSQAKPAKQYSVNKYASNQQNNYIKPNPSTKQAKKNPELLYTVDMPTDEKKSTVKSTNITSKNIYIEQNKKQIEKKRTSKPRIISEIKIPAKTSATEYSVASGLYVQAGSFRNIDVANSQLKKIKKITNNPSNVQIQQATVKNKKYYRIVIGPITKKNTAKIIRNNLKKRGQSSILIKVK